MEKEQKIILIINWACVAALAALFIVATRANSGFRNGTIGIGYGAIVGLFNSIWFTVRHKKYAFGIPSLILSCIELIFVLEGVALSLAEIVHGGQVAVLIGVILLFLIMGALVVKLINEIKLLKAYRSGKIKPAIPYQKKEFRIVPFREWFYVTHPKTLFFMGGGFISMMSIFGMFGSVYKNSGLGITQNGPYNMFEAAFGLAKSVDTTKNLPLSVGLIVLLAILGILLILSIVDFFRGKKIGGGFFVYNSIRMALTLAALILAFCSLKFIDDPYCEMTKDTLKLGPGPISVAVLNIIAFVSYCTGVVIQMVDYVKHNPSSLTKVKTEKVKSIKVTPSSKDNNIELLREYKKLLDEGVITKKEFDEKKKDLL